MGAENLGAATASGRHHPTPVERSVADPDRRPVTAAGEPRSDDPRSAGSPASAPDAAIARRLEPILRRTPARPGQRWVVALVLAALALGGGANPVPTARATASYLLMPRSELLALPTSGTAWTALKAVADAPLSTPDLCDQNANHHLETFAAALVYARTGTASYGSKARAAVMAAIQTQRDGCPNAVLALGRQLTAYVLAANLADLSGTDDAAFRSWLSGIRTRVIGGHPTWNSLDFTHGNSPNNWGAYAGASRIAADLYLGDATDAAAAALVTRGFLGDRTAYAGFTHNLTSAAISWSCTGSTTTYTPENAACSRNGINLDGGVAADISRGGSLRWPPADPGIPYQLEAIQGVGLQVELLYRNGYPGAWSWANDGLKRAAAIVSRSAASGGTGWNATSTSRQMPWLLNLRYGTAIPTRASGMGRAIGFTDWLYGSGAAPTSGGTGSGGTGSGGTGSGGTGSGSSGSGSTTAAPLTSAPTVRLAAAAVAAGRIPTVVRWRLASSSDGVRRYVLQVSVDGGAFASLALATPTTTARAVALAAGHRYVFRTRAVDLAGRVGAWTTTAPFRGAQVGDASAAVTYRGTWRIASLVSYLGGRVHYTRSAGATAAFRFSGTAIAIIGPRGPGRGRSVVSIDGTAVATIDQWASSFAPRRMLFVRNLGPGTHAIVVRALGTSRRPMVAIDAFEVLARL